MCLTATALSLFINLIGVDRTTRSPDLVIVHATAGDVHWIASDDVWCIRPARPEGTIPVSKG